MGIFKYKPDKDIQEYFYKLDDLYFTKDQIRKRNYVVFRVLCPLILGASGLYLLAYSGRLALYGIPAVHSNAITQGYKNREHRHLQYVKENPTYVSALLKGYESLRPPKDF